MITPKCWRKICGAAPAAGCDQRVMTLAESLSTMVEGVSCLGADPGRPLVYRRSDAETVEVGMTSHPFAETTDLLKQNRFLTGSTH
jgi:hypothetical protein